TARVSAELRLSGIKVLALMSMEGWASERVRDLAEASRTLLPQSNTHEHTVSTLFALFLHYHVASKRTDCRRVVDELVDFADRIQDASLQAVAAMTKGVDYHAGGRFLEAETWLEKGRNLYDPERDRHHAAIFGMDCYVWATAQLAWVQWGMGRTTRSFELAEEAIDWARKVQHIPSLALGLLYITQIHQMNGDRDAVRARSSELLETAGTFGLPAYEAYGAALAAWASRDLEGIEQIIGTLKSLNCNLILTFYGSFLSDIEAEAGRLPEAIAQVERWLEACGELDEHVYEPELLRRRGLFEMHLDEPDVEHARRALQTARSLAREQGMYLFEAAALRDLTRLFGASDEWRERLVEINRTYSDVTLE
ncbi:MAG: hypothetical protein PVH47_06185, partial [Thiohalocapsa sp.]